MPSVLERLPRLAVLIDADNASPAIAKALFAEIATIGEASVRRIYGDFSKSQMKGWADILSAHAIIPSQNFALTVGKNAADIALVIDAMDLLASGRFDGFCLVSSDSDFTRLAARIREQGIDVFGFGERKTPESFRMACKRFTFTENLRAPQTEPVKKPEPANGRKIAPSDAVPLLASVLASLEDHDGWFHLGAIGQRLTTVAPDFDPRTYGCSKLVNLFEATGAYCVRRQNLTVHVKPKAQPE